MGRTTLTVEGMACGGCEANVEEAVGALEGTESVEADTESDTVEIVGDLEDDAVRAAIEDAGYSVAT